MAKRKKAASEKATDEPPQGLRNPDYYPEMLQYHLGVFDLDCWPADGNGYVFSRRVSALAEGEPWVGRGVLYPPDDTPWEELLAAIKRANAECREYLLVVPDNDMTQKLTGKGFAQMFPDEKREIHVVPHNGGLLIAVGECLAETLSNAAWLGIV